MLHIPLDSTQALRLISVISFCERQVELENWRSVTQMMQTIISALFGKQTKKIFYINNTIIKEIQEAY